MIALRPLARLAGAPAHTLAARRCELCTVPIDDRHRHVIEVGLRGCLCVCHPCAVLFIRTDPNTRYRTVPDRVRIDPRFRLSPEALGIPVGVAFCVRESESGRVVAFYPGPAGIVDAELAPDAWGALAAATPLAALLEPDVEALLVRRDLGMPGLTCYLVPITAAYELAGRLRTSWKGFTGGDVARHEITAFFADLDRKGKPV